MNIRSVEQLGTKHSKLSIAAVAGKNAKLYKLVKFAGRQDALENVKPISYLELAKAAREKGKNRLFWIIFKQHARVKRKERRLLEQANAR